MAAHELTWTHEEVVALLDVWSDAAVQAELQGAYRNDHIYRRIVSELAARGFQRNAKRCRDKLKALKKKYKEVIDRHRRSGAGVESDEEVTQGDFQFFSQIHRVLGGRAVVNPPHLLEVGSRSQSPASESATPVAQPAVSRLRSSSSSSRPSTPEMLSPPPPAMEEVEAEDTQGPAVEQPETETAAQQPETEPRTEQPETEPAAEQPETVTEQPVPETAEQSVPAPSRAKKRKLTKAERAQKEVSATLSKLTAQGEDLKSALILLDDRRAKREAEQMKREEERESRMFALLSSMFGSSAPPHGQHSAVPPVPNIYHSPSMQAGFPSTMPPGVPPTMPPSIPSSSMYSFPYSPGGDDDEEDDTFTP